MAICSKESTLVASTAQTFSFNDLLGQPAASLVYQNDDASAVHLLTINGNTFHVKAGEQQVLTGCERYAELTIGGDVGSTGAYRCRASTDAEPPVLLKYLGASVATANIADGAVTEAKLQAASTRDVLAAKRCGVAVLDPSGNAAHRAVGTVLFGPTLPDNAIVTYAWWEVVTGFDSAASLATVSLGVATDGVAGIVAATLVSAAGLVAAGVFAGTPTGTAVTGFVTKTTAARQFAAVIAVEDLTVGKLELHFEYEVGA